MCESFVTYINKGSLELNMEDFPELQGKTNQEINIWLSENSNDLYVNWEGRIRKDNLMVYEEDELEEGDLPEEDDEAVILSDYFRDAGVAFDKIKNEDSYFVTED